jgi:hypothetical protein
MILCLYCDYDACTPVGLSTHLRVLLSPLPGVVYSDVCRTTLCGIARVYLTDSRASKLRLKLSVAESFALYFCRLDEAFRQLDTSVLFRSVVSAAAMHSGRAGSASARVSHSMWCENQKLANCDLKDEKHGAVR